MTVTDRDLATYDDTTDEFTPQHEFLDCLPAALKSIIDELRGRRDDFNLHLSLSKCHDICDYNQYSGCTEENIKPKLDPQMKGFEIREARLLEYDTLDKIIENDSCSYPIVDLNMGYIESVKELDLLHGEPSKVEEVKDFDEMTHTIIPCKVNSEKVLLWDPLCEIIQQSPRVSEAPKTRSKPEFHQWWSHTPDIRWSLWIERKIQQSLG